MVKSKTKGDCGMESSKSRSKEGKKRTKRKPSDPIYSLNPSSKDEVQTEERPAFSKGQRGNVCYME